MIVGLIGRVHKKGAASVHFNVNGVVYEVFMSLNGLSAAEGECEILTTQIIREDSSALYGFLNREEKELFEALIKVNGVGPKVAMAICSALLPRDFAAAAQNGDVERLKKVPGIGEKTAKRILVEISGKLDLSDTAALPQAKREALLGLEQLGFKSPQITALVEKSQITDAAGIIKEVLRSQKG